MWTRTHICKVSPCLGGNLCFQTLYKQHSVQTCFVPWRWQLCVRRSVQRGPSPPCQASWTCPFLQHIRHGQTSASIKQLQYITTLLTSTRYKNQRWTSRTFKRLLLLWLASVSIEQRKGCDTFSRCFFWAHEHVMNTTFK